MATCVDIKTVIVLEMRNDNFANMNNDEMFTKILFVLITKRMPVVTINHIKLIIHASSNEWFFDSN